jgi:endo-1,4-beta-xylanase
MIRSDSHSHDLWLSRVEALACVLLSLIFILRSGLPLGVGNQSLQMVWMAHLRDPLLFAADDVVQSFRSFPSWFFPVLAQLIPDNMPLGAALQILQVLNTVLLFLGVAVLTRSVFPGMRWVLLPLVFLLTGPYQALADDWVTLGAACRADYVVLPREAAQGLVWVAENEDWVLAETRLTPPPPLPPAPENAIDPGDWLAQERFMLEVVDANIEKYRKGRVTLRLLDAGGVALAGLPVEIDQMSLDFGIGSALHHFEPVVEVEKQYRASINHPLELERFKEVFNYSVMGYSGKWMYLEPEPDQRDYRDLDAYVAWCEQNGIRIEYHFVTGYAPKWMEKLPRAEQRSRLLAHAKDLIDRYGDRFDQWQVINERRMQNEAPEVFALFRAELPDAELGVSDCARFYSPRKGDQARKDLQRGMESMLQITKAGQAVDFFAIHAHRPEGTWGDPRTMYEVMDAFAEKGARLHISETGINHTGKIDGKVLRGEWNDELQAEYMVRFMKVAFSHPAVGVVNFWGFGPRTWQRHIGLLDENYEPRPAFLALKKLVRETWHTRLETRSGSAGDVRLHGFHGGYRVTVSHPDGRIGEGEFHLGADSPEALTVRVIWTDPHL